MTFQALPGFRDFPPDELAFRAHIVESWRRVARRYGFVEYDGPPLEPEELYTAKSGEEIVGQLFNFVDKGDRRVALRPEMTPTFARMVSQHAKAAPKPIRWFSVPQLFRYEKQQRGRLREHFQLNCDLVGEAGPLADAEVIALAIDVCRELGLTAEDFKVRLADRRVVSEQFSAFGLSQEKVFAAFAALDKINRAGVPWARETLKAAGLTDTELLDVIQFATATEVPDFERLMQSPQAEAAAANLRGVVDALDAMGLRDYVEVDFSIVRGLAYYTGTVFELFDRQGKLRAICGGGRYDTLLQSLGGADLPAVGFGMGDVVLGELLKDRGLRPAAPAAIDCFVVAVTTEDRAEVLQQAHRLRDAGFAVEYALESGEPKVGKQLKLAGTRGARLAVVIGPDDRARGEAQCKDLVHKTQVAVPLDRLVERCRDILSGTD